MCMPSTKERERENGCCCCSHAVLMSTSTPPQITTAIANRCLCLRVCVCASVLLCPKCSFRSLFLSLLHHRHRHRLSFSRCRSSVVRQLFLSFILSFPLLLHRHRLLVNVPVPLSLGLRHKRAHTHTHRGNVCLLRSQWPP